MEVTLQTQVKENSSQQLAKAQDPIERFRYKATLRGLSTIKTIGKSFKIMDNDRSGRLNKEEFWSGCHQWGVKLDKGELDQLFSLFDKNMDGSMDYEEFLTAIRPPMSDARKLVVKKAFYKVIDKSDSIRKEQQEQQQQQQQQQHQHPQRPEMPRSASRTGSKRDCITLDDMALIYDGREHPKFKNGEMTEREVIKQFLDNFQPGDQDEVITLEEFTDYYAVLSMSIDIDAGFSFMIQRSWGVSPVDSLPVHNSNKKY